MDRDDKFVIIVLTITLLLCLFFTTGEPDILDGLIKIVNK